MACARNDKLFTDGSDQAQLAKQVRYVIGGTDEVAKTFRVIALPKSWQTDPWSTLDEAEQPERWDDRLPILVLPEEPDSIDQRLGRWLKDHLQKRRNTIRFLLPRSGSTNAFQDRDLLILARAEMKAQEWSSHASTRVPDAGAPCCGVHAWGRNVTGAEAVRWRSGREILNNSRQ